MSWILANPNGILAQGSTQGTFGTSPPQFNADTVNGIVHFDADDPQLAITLVSTPTSGVWRLDDPDKGTWTALSLKWGTSDLTCLVKGRRAIFDVFAAGGSANAIVGEGTLWGNNWSGEFDTWSLIDLSLFSTGIVNSVTTITPSGLPIIVLACDNGLF